jgi:uncharacterized protein
MVLERVWKGLLVVAVVGLVALFAVQLGVVATPWSEDQTEVRVLDEDGDPKAVVDAEVADTYSERYTGLSDHDSLDSGEGMLFVHGDEGERTYVMRGMDFGIDIIFIGADREITTIHEAPAPGPGEDGNEQRYTGTAQWVLEVPIGYASETGIEVGDEVEIDSEDE